MQFSLFLYDNESFHDHPEAKQMEIVGEYMAYSEKLKAAGAFIGGEPLDPSSSAKTLRAGGRVEDGPYADTKEQLGGFYIIEVASEAEAISWARECPAFKHGGSIEVRPIPNYAGG